MRKTLLPFAAVVAVATPVHDGLPRDLRAWHDAATAGEAEGRTANHRLIGLGCGPDRLTMTAVEEDHFPAPCDTIATPEELCPEDPAFADTALSNDPITVAECALYMGDGW